MKMPEFGWRILNYYRRNKFAHWPESKDSGPFRWEQAVEEEPKERFLGFVQEKLEQRKSVLPDAAKTFEGISTIAAWQVAVASPGFLGLLWNAKDLAAQTRLPHIGFYMLFVGAELAFLAAIIGSVILHDYATQVTTKMGLVKIAGHNVSLAIDVLNEEGGKNRPNLDAFNEAVTQHDDVRSFFSGRAPRPVEWAGQLNGTTTVTGYVFVGILIIAMKLF